MSPLDQLAPRAMAGAFTGLSEDGVITTDLAEKMRKSVGFRNVAIQQYERINWTAVYSIAADQMCDSKAFEKRFQYCSSKFIF